MNQEERDLDLLEALQKMGHAQRRTGVVLIAASAVVVIGVAFDFPGGTAVAAVALSLITVNGLTMCVQAGKLLKVIDRGVIKMLRSRGIR